MFIKDLQVNAVRCTSEKTRRDCGKGGEGRWETRYQSADIRFLALWMNTTTLHRFSNIVKNLLTWVHVLSSFILVNKFQSAYDRYEDNEWDDRWVNEDWGLSCQLSPYFHLSLFFSFVILCISCLTPNFLASRHRQGTWTVWIIQEKIPYINHDKDLLGFIHWIFIHEAKGNENWFQFR